MIEFNAALQRLRNNRDFQTVITKGYFEQEAVRLVHLKADPAMQSEANQKGILAQIDSIGALSDYFRTIGRKAYLAEKQIEADEEMRDELIAEEAAQ